MNPFTALGLLLSFSGFSAFASMESAGQEGQQWAQSLQPKVQNSINSAALADVPRFAGDAPKETQLNQNGDFQEAIHKALGTEDFAKDFGEMSKKRPRFKLDPKTDPLFRVREEADKKFGIDPNATRIPREETLETTCEEGGEAVTYECIEDRYVMPQVPFKTTTLWVNHLNFVPKIEQDVIKHKGKWNKHGSVSYVDRQNGYILTLHKDIKAFKEAFCPKFTGIDAKTKEVFAMDCSRIEGYQLNPASSVSNAQDSVSIHVSTAMVNISLFHRTYEGEEIDEWRSTHCGPLEEMVAQGLCHYGKRVLVEGAGTRMIQGYAITKDDWQYRQYYDCQVIKDECAALRAQGCHPLSSDCKEMREGRCWIYEQRYQCPKGDLGLAQVQSPPDSIFCLTGDCQSTHYKANGELLEAISRLALLKEIQDELRANHHKALSVFKGEDKRCTRNCLNFKDCCRRLKGWGVSLGLTDCDEEAHGLAQRRELHQCYQVGTYCAHRDPLLKKCTSKKTSFCCFGNRFARLLQEQGRAQLGLGWGTAEGPDCRGLTTEELSRLDLSRMNFSELFEDLMKKYKKPDAKILEQKTHEKIQDNLHHMTQRLERQDLSPQTGKLNANQDSL